MNRATRFLAAALAGGLLSGGCEQSQPDKPQASTVSTPAPLARNWPPMTGNPEDKVAGSRNLFAHNYYVVLDASGSMKDSGCSAGRPKIEVARAALSEFAGRMSADANLGLQVFDDNGIREWLPLDTGNRDRFRQALNGVNAGGGTPLRASIRQAYQQLTAQGAKQLGYGEYHLVVVTDGEANADQNPDPVVNEIIGNSPVILHTIGFCIGTSHSLNQPGRVLYRAADNPEQLKQGLGEVLAEAPVFNAASFK